MNSSLKVLRHRLACVNKAIRRAAPDGNYCARCCAVDVYWMSMWCEGRMRPILFDNATNRRHVCPIVDDFEVQE